MKDAAVTAVATVFLVLVGLVQAGVLAAQHRQHRLDLAEAYRRRWADARECWATLVFIGREPTEYYQLASPELLAQLTAAEQASSYEASTVWAQEAVRPIAVLLSDVCLRILQGQIRVSDVYPVFGTELLRHSRPLRTLLDPAFSGPVGAWGHDENHEMVRWEIQGWLELHDGIRRRCLILVDLLWAEAARLEDLPFSDLMDAADAKRATGKLNRERLRSECYRLRGPLGVARAVYLSRFLRHSEYRTRFRRTGLDPEHLRRMIDGASEI